MRALVVGGTGPTGPHIVHGLLERGYEVSIFHRGTHESHELPPIEHIHGDPHFAQTIAEALNGRRFDLVIAAYGRVRLLAEALAGRCDRFVAIGGVAAYPGAMNPAAVHPHGMALLAREDAATAEASGGASDADRFSRLVAATERKVLELHHDGAFEATVLRYPSLYGPRQVAPAEWSVIKRVLDGRPFMILPDGGLSVYSRAAAANAAHCVLLAVDQPAVAAGRVYNVADDDQFTLRQWMEMIVDHMGGRLALLSLPRALATASQGLAAVDGHALVDATRARLELGYRDVVQAQQALGATIDWYLDNPVESAATPWLTDRFDYDAEDQLAETYRAAIAHLSGAAGAVPSFVHPYAHPDTPGVARDHRQR